MSKKIIITEEEKKQIKNLYNIKEQSTSNILSNLLSDLFFGNGKEEKNDSEDDSYLNDTSSGSVDSKWMNVTKKVIDKFEGGYWNPVCGHKSSGMGSSTETMFGLDRYRGNIESTSDGKEFFRLIDEQKSDLGIKKFCKKWHWNYRGGELEDELKTLAAKIMKRSYDRNVSNYFSPELKKRVEANDRLLMHFSYASWNGPGFFKKFAKSLDNGIKSGKSDSELIKQAITDRKNTALLHQDKVAAVLTSTDLGLA